MSRPVGLHPDDLTRVMSAFGVAETQVRRDNAVSHILATLSQHHRDDLIFFGGTALSRTYLVDERLSEDIDLIATIPRNTLATALIRTSPPAWLAPTAASPGPHLGTTTHDLRHHYASVLLDAGKSVVTVAARLGHKDAQLVLTTYGHLMPSSEDRTRKAVDSAW